MTTAVAPVGRQPDQVLIDMLTALPAGYVVAQLDDGSLAICESVSEADNRILESRTESRPRGRSRVARRQITERLKESPVGAGVAEADETSG